MRYRLRALYPDALNLACRRPLSPLPQDRSWDPLPGLRFVGAYTGGNYRAHAPRNGDVELPRPAAPPENHPPVGRQRQEVRGIGP